MNGNNVTNVKCETCSNSEKQINGPETNIQNKITRDLHKGYEFKKMYTYRIAKR
jgi:hypothetical protein